MSDLASPVILPRSRTMAYWITTVLLALECAVGGVMDILQLPPFLTTLVRLGYPSYFSIILGVWKLLAVTPPGALVGPVAFTGLTLASWALRPPARRESRPR